MEQLATNLTNSLQEAGISPLMVVFVISLLPILELRGGLIAAAILGVDYVPALLVSILGNALPVPLILWLVTPLFTWLKKRKRIRPFVEKIENRALKKKDKVEKAEFWGLLLFVGIPLPGTGAWTGSLLATILGIDLKKGVPAVCFGILLAAAIMSAITYLIPWMIQQF